MIRLTCLGKESINAGIQGTRTRRWCSVKNDCAQDFDTRGARQKPLRNPISGGADKLKRAPDLQETLVTLLADFSRGLTVELGQRCRDRVACCAHGLFRLSMGSADRLRDDGVYNLELD